MAYINDTALDQLLGWIDTNGTRLDICSQEPTTYAEATSTYTLGNKTGITINAPEDATPDGRKVVVVAVAGGDVTATGTATHVALTDGTSLLVLTEALSSSQGVTSGNTFSLTQFDVRVPDAV